MFEPKNVNEKVYEGTDMLYLQNYIVKKLVEDHLFLHLMPQLAEGDKPKFMHLCWNRFYPTFFAYMYRRFGTPCEWDNHRSLGVYHLTTPKKGVYLTIAFLTYGFIHIEIVGTEKHQKEIAKEKRDLHLAWQNGLHKWAKETHNYVFAENMEQSELNEKYHAFLIENKCSPQNYDNEKWSENFLAGFRKREDELKHEYGKAVPYPNDREYKHAQSCIKAALATVDYLLQTTQIGDTDMNLFGKIGEKVNIGDMLEFRVTDLRKDIADYFGEKTK